MIVTIYRVSVPVPRIRRDAAPMAYSHAINAAIDGFGAAGCDEYDVDTLEEWAEFGTRTAAERCERRLKLIAVLGVLDPGRIRCEK